MIGGTAAAADGANPISAHRINARATDTVETSKETIGSYGADVADR